MPEAAKPALGTRLSLGDLATLARHVGDHDSQATT
jgi:hypothetical protein